MCISLFLPITHISKECRSQVPKNWHFSPNALATPRLGLPPVRLKHLDNSCPASPLT